MISTAADTLSNIQPRDEDSLARIRKRRRWLLASIAAVIFTPVIFAAMWPVTFDSREELFEIPKGTWARRMAGEKREILPPEIRLVVGTHNVLLLKNSDDVPQIFGPTLLMPGQSLRIPFTTPSENYFNCTAHASGKLLIVVEAAPTWPWSRLSWRVKGIMRTLFHSENSPPEIVDHH